MERQRSDLSAARSLVDSEESLPTSDGKLMSFSIPWDSVKSDEILTSISQEFDEVRRAPIDPFRQDGNHADVRPIYLS